MGLFSEKKPYTAISSECEALMDHDPQSDPAKLVNLIELIQGTRPSSSGGHEAGRFLRKKLKYGTPAEQSRALSLVETLVDNGIKTSAFVIDSGLSDQLMQLAAQHTTHKADLTKAAKVSRQCRSLLRDWTARKDRNISSLYTRAGLVDRHDSQRRHRQSFNPDDDLDDEVFGQDGKLSPPRHNHHTHTKSNVSSFSEAPRSPRSPRESRSPLPRSGHSGGRSLSRSPSPINLRGASIESTIATAHNIATRLTNALIANPHGSRETATYYRQGKQLRHRVIQLVHDSSEEVQSYIGQLLAANEELVTALQTHDAVIENGERLQTREDHASVDLLSLDSAAVPPVHPARPPPPLHRPADSSDSEGFAAENNEVLERSGSPRAATDDFDPFADDFEQAERPKHTPIW